MAACCLFKKYEDVDLGRSFTGTCAAIFHLRGHASAHLSVQELPMEPAGLWNCGCYHGCSYEERASPRRGWGIPIDSGWSCEEDKDEMSLGDKERNRENQTGYDEKDTGA